MATTRLTGPPAPLALPLTPGDARRKLQGMLAGTRWCRNADSVVLAVHEALTNADRHGGGAVRAQASIDRGALVVAVWDRGTGFELPAGDPDDPFAEHGRGLCLIRRIASRVEAGREGSGFCLRLWFDPQ